jgi:Family of unknown function (DUF6454)
MLPTEQTRPHPARHGLPGAAVVLLAIATMSSNQPAPANGLAERVGRLTRDSAWRSVSSIPVAFPTHHPQGMVKVGDTFFVSSVEVRVPTVRFETPVDGYDRDPGQGVGHLFKMTMTGALISDLTLGEATMYHPGGIDYDGRHIWVSVAEYRPNSRSIVYRIDPEGMKAVEVFRYPDHLGGIVHNTDDHTLHAVSWGSRRFYRWTLDRNERVTNATVPPETLRRLNPSHYVDYQDCKYVGGRRMLCSGVTEIRPSRGGAPFRLGGLDLIDLRDGRPLHQVPVLLWTAGGLDMTHNPAWFEPAGTGIRAYFMPEDNASTIYVYETGPT